MEYELGGETQGAPFSKDWLTSLLNPALPFKSSEGASAVRILNCMFRIFPISVPESKNTNKRNKSLDCFRIIPDE